jgi:hypothetical protein
MFDCQPTKWRDDFTQHKGLLTDFDLEVVMHYFCNQEMIALRSEEMNRDWQKNELEIKRHSAPPGAANGSHASCGSNGKQAKHDPYTPCHEHLNKDHLWKDCFKNPDNPSKAKCAKAAVKGNPGKKSNGHVAEVDAEATVHDDGHVAEVLMTENNKAFQKRFLLLISGSRNWRLSLRMMVLSSLKEWST